MIQNSQTRHCLRRYTSCGSRFVKKSIICVINLFYINLSLRDVCGWSLEWCCWSSPTHQHHIIVCRQLYLFAMCELTKLNQKMLNLLFHPTIFYRPLPLLASMYVVRTCVNVISSKFIIIIVQNALLLL